MVEIPIDPEVKEFLESFYKLDIAIDPTKYSIEEIRKKMNALFAEALPKEPIHKIEDIKIRSDDYDLPIRIYYPDDKKGHGIILHFHGGAWIFGNLDTEDSISRILANHCGCIVVSVDYRLAPEHKFPAAVNDCFNSLLWSINNAERIGGDPRKIATFGISAGGNLAAATSILSKEKGVKLKAQALVVPFVYLDVASRSMNEYRKGYFLDIDTSALSWLFMYIRNESDLINPLFQPLLANDLSGMPETIILTAEYDPLRDQGEAYAGRLRESGVPTISMRLNGMIHAFLGSPRVQRQSAIIVSSLLKDILTKD
ncbi:MAG: alpha/beta hydrolase [Caldisphaeraceae archaeon]|nr:alpha/beta hydrolase [Caldisphaeraceae archaeon]MEB3691675.1 alpha/beta hydrolase [Caldisphaeraceae archaeon]MEB3798064.1 alpha/beta hydrolase [Caldisphaeraceae archaeon]